MYKELLSTTLKSYDVQIEPKKKERKRTLMYLSKSEKYSIMSDVGDSGYILIEEYYRRSATKHTLNMKDSLLATSLGWTESKVKRLRLSLIKTGWFRNVTFTYNGVKKEITYLGKEAVAQAPTNENIEYISKLIDNLLSKTSKPTNIHTFGTAIPYQEQNALIKKEVPEEYIGTIRKVFYMKQEKQEVNS